MSDTFVPGLGYKSYVINLGHTELTNLEGIHSLLKHAISKLLVVHLYKLQPLCFVILENESKTKLALTVFAASKAFSF